LLWKGGRSVLSNEQIERLREVTEVLAAALANREERVSVEVRGSVRADRLYIGASKESTNEHYAIQIDVM
jgi:hypothetical protein